MRCLPSFSSSSGFGGLSFELPINIFNDVAENRDARSHQASDQQSLYRSLEDRASVFIVKRRRILRQLIMGNRNQPSKLVQENNLARLVCRRNGLRMFDRRLL